MLTLRVVADRIVFVSSCFESDISTGSGVRYHGGLQQCVQTQSVDEHDNQYQRDRVSQGAGCSYL